MKLLFAVAIFVFSGSVFAAFECTNSLNKIEAPSKSGFPILIFTEYLYVPHGYYANLFLGVIRVRTKLKFKHIQ